jgi:hypothetical protein
MYFRQCLRVCLRHGRNRVGFAIDCKILQEAGGNATNLSSSHVAMLPPRATKAIAVLKATEQPIDTRTAAGKCFFDMLGVHLRLAL